MNIRPSSTGKIRLSSTGKIRLSSTEKIRPSSTGKIRPSNTEDIRSQYRERKAPVQGEKIRPCATFRFWVPKRKALGGIL